MLIFKYIKGIYNRKRRHFYLGYLHPATLRKKCGLINN
ncbi:hypothetical protein ISS03_05310 [Patescibacteria group bacterium]|nr:hypothetical protein [Patescibacteria group bacterium]